MEELSTLILSELGIALKQFGTYSFDDKGPSEVMDIPDLARKLRCLDSDVAAKIIIEVSKSKKYKGRGYTVAQTLVQYLENWDELFLNDDIKELY